MIGAMMAVNHWPNQVLLAGASKGPMMLSFGMAWCKNSHRTNEKCTLKRHWPSEVLLAGVSNHYKYDILYHL